MFTKVAAEARGEQRNIITCPHNKQALLNSSLNIITQATFKYYTAYIRFKHFSYVEQNN